MPSARLRSPRLATSGSHVSLGFSSTVPATNSGKDVILCIGDSLTAGKKGFRSYPSQLQRLLDEDGLQLKVHSSGVWGHTSQDVLKRLPSALQSAFTEGGRLAFVLILVGTNDLLHSHPQHVDYQIPNTINNIRAICETAANAAFFPHVGVLTLPPLASRNPARLKLNQQLRQFMAGYAAQKGFSKRFLVDLESLNPHLAHDGVHFNDEGYMEFARRTRAAILPILQAETESKSRIVTTKRGNSSCWWEVMNMAYMKGLACSGDCLCISRSLAFESLLLGPSCHMCKIACCKETVYCMDTQSKRCVSSSKESFCFGYRNLDPLFMNEQHQNEIFHVSGCIMVGMTYCRFLCSP